MIIVLPLFCLPLGLVGMIIAGFIGLLCDQILLMLLASKSVLRIVNGSSLLSKWPNVGLDRLTISEVALLEIAFDYGNRGQNDSEVIHNWLSKHVSHSRLFYPYHPLICNQLYSMRKNLDLSVLLNCLASGDNMKRRLEFFCLVVSLVSDKILGIEQSGLDLLVRIGVGINLSNVEFELSLHNHCGVNQDANRFFLGLIPGFKNGLNRIELGEAFKYSVNKLKEDSEEIKNARIAFTIIEDQLDMIDRAIVGFRKTLVGN